MKSNSKKTSFWTEARVARLQKLYSQYGSKEAWATKISKQFRSAVTPSAVYKKAARIGLSKPTWVLREVDKTASRRTKNS